MPESTALTMGDVLEKLRSENLMKPEDIERCATYLEEKARKGTPWYLKMMSAIGAWIAAGVFVSIVGLISHDHPAIAGFIFLGAGLLLYHSIQNIFVYHLAIALSLAGQAAILIEVDQAHLLGRGTDNFWQLVVVAAIMCAALYPIFASSVHRFLTCLAVLALTVAWVIEAEQYSVLHAIVLAEIVAAGLMFVNSRYYEWLKPMAYAIAVALPLTVFAVVVVNSATATSRLDDHTRQLTPLWPSQLILTLGMLLLLWWVADGIYGLNEPVIVAALATVALGAVTSPGILVGIGLLVFGYAIGEKPLIVLGYLFLPAFLVYFYYDMQADLLTKSGILAASGAVLLAARTILSRRPWSLEETS